MKTENEIEGQSTSETPALNVDSIARVIQSRRSTELPTQDVINSLEFEGEVISQPELLGSGGTKEVFDVEIEGKHYAIALCGTQDTAERALEKWKKVFREPSKTKALKEMGFYVNDLCEVRNVKVNGIDFPALVMKRFEDHSFEIYDSKNIGGNRNPLFDEETELNDDEMVKSMRFISEEIVKLISEGIRLGRDSFNLCLSEGQMHLYFNDLGTAKIEPFDKSEKEQVASLYVMHAIGAVVSSVSEEAYKNNPYLNKMGDLESSLKTKLEKHVTKQLS